MRQKTSTRLQKKYNRLFKKLQQALQSGRFLTYSATRKIRLLARLQRYERRLQCKGIAVAGVATLMLGTPLLQAQGALPLGTEFQVNTFTTNLQRFSSIGVDSDGNFVITWSSYGQDGDDDGIYAQRYNRDGTPQGSEFQVNTYTTDSQSFPSIGVDSDGDFVITWVSSNQDGSSTGIYAQRYSSDGAPQGSEFQVNTYTTANQSSPSIGVDSDGDFVVTWRSDEQDDSFYGIYAQRYASDGTPQGSEFQVNTYTTSAQTSPSIGLDSDGNFVITWVSGRFSGAGQDGSLYGIYAQRYSSDGIPQGSEFQVNTYTTNRQITPSVGVDSDGDFAITWISNGQDGYSFGVYAQRYARDGTPQGNEFQVNTFTTFGQNRPNIGVDSDGDFVITWQSSNQDGFGTGIYAQRYASDGTPQGSEFQVNTFTTFGQNRPSIGVDSDGDFVITWESGNQDGFFYGIYAQRYEIEQATFEIPNINSLVLQTCTRPYSATFDPVTDAIGYQVQITVLARNGEVITQRIADNEINDNFNIPRRLLGTDVEIQIASIFLDDETGEEIIGEFSETGTFTLGCDEAGNLVLESRNVSPTSIQLSPNPVRNQLQIELQSELAGSSELKVFNLDGKILLERTHQLFAGQNELNFDVKQLAAGTYFLQVHTGQQVQQLKFVKL
ncbi:MAG: T9SS type A sorting domain-containing protein [Bacteroidota bacterium]